MPLRDNPLDKLWLRQWKEDLGATEIACRNAEEFRQSIPSAREHRTSQVESEYAKSVRLAYVEYVDDLWDLVASAPRYPDRSQNRGDLSSSWNTKVQEIAQVAQAPDGPVSLMIRDCLAEEKESAEELRKAAVKLAESAQHLLAQSDVWVAVQFVPRTLGGRPRGSDPNAGSLVPALTHVLSQSERDSFSVADAGDDPDSIADAVLAGRSLMFSAVARESPVSHTSVSDLIPSPPSVPSGTTTVPFSSIIRCGWSHSPLHFRNHWFLPSLRKVLGTRYRRSSHSCEMRMSEASILRFDPPSWNSVGEQTAACVALL